MVSVLPGLGGAQFGPAVNYQPCSFVKNLTVAELDGRPGADVAVTSNCFKATTLLNDGGGQLAIGGSFGTGYTSGEIAAYSWDDVSRVRGKEFRYRVCETGRFTSCSAEVTATF